WILRREGQRDLDSEIDPIRALEDQLIGKEKLCGPESLLISVDAAVERAVAIHERAAEQIRGVERPELEREERRAILLLPEARREHSAHHEVHELLVLGDHRHVVDDRGKLGRLLDPLADYPGHRPAARLAVARELRPDPDGWRQAQLGPEGQRGRVLAGPGPDVDRRRYEPTGAGHDVLGAHPAGFRADVAAEADGLPDFLELARMVVPVMVEHGADVHIDHDLVRAHELLEERNACLA